MTPLQMAMVAATIANDGVVMEPQVVERIVAPDGSTSSGSRPDELGRAVSPRRHVRRGDDGGAVEEGTGTAAQISGVRVAGKTGTAETGIAGLNTTWFIGFARQTRPEVAIAVVVEQQNGDRRPDSRPRSQRPSCRRFWGRRRTP